MGDLLVPLTALGTALLLLGVCGSWIVLRRIRLTRGVGTFDCSFRREGNSAGTGGWMLGVARYEADRLDWFRVFTLDPRPARSLARHRLTIIERRTLPHQVSYSILPGWVVVRCSYGALTIELAMSDAAYNGLAAWLESSPPGQFVHVA